MYNIYITQTSLGAKKFSITAKKASEEAFLSDICDRFICGKHILKHKLGIFFIGMQIIAELDELIIIAESGQINPHSVKLSIKSIDTKKASRMEGLVLIF